MSEFSFQRTVLSPPTEIITSHDSSSSTPGSVSKESPSDLHPIRRSTRDIKRKKFDDEIFASTLPLKSPLKKVARLSVDNVKIEMKPGMGIMGQTEDVGPSASPGATPVFDHDGRPVLFDNVQQQHSLPPRRHSVAITTSSVGASMDSTSLTHSATPNGSSLSAAAAKKRGRQSKKFANVAVSSVLVNPIEVHERLAALKDVGRWQPTDDLALITAVMQTNDLTQVYTGVKFSCKFTLLEIQARWYALLYDPGMSKLAQEAMKKLSPELISAVQSSTLFSKSEEKSLAAIAGNSNPSLETFDDLLNKHPEVFHFARTSRSLKDHWENMKEFRLLNDQKPLVATLDQVQSFSDIEDNFDETEQTPMSNAAERELRLSERQTTSRIRQYESELPKWHVLVECVTGVVAQEFDATTVAALRGRLVRYLMRSRDATIGRNAKGNVVDIDLTLEGPAYKISRKQGTIKLRTTGDFFITNEGKRPFYVDGKPVVTNSKMKLHNNAVLEISCIRLIFMVNLDLINAMKAEGTKLMLA